MLKAFTGTDGDHPRSDLILSNGTLYGTTEDGGSQNEGTVFKVNVDGTGYTVLKHFGPSMGLLAALTLHGGALYGTASYGGSLGYGTLFKVNTDGTGFRV